MQIVSQIIKQSLVNWKSLKWLQSSKLKDIGEHGITKLKNSLKENNFVQPFNVWEDSKGVIWILDGHHREKALTQLEAEGYEIPETLPANFIDCKDKKEAAKMVLLYSSIYAKITNEGLGEFLDDFDLDLSNLVNEIDLPGLDFDNILEPETLPEDIDEAPQPLEKTYSILGDVFEIEGKHRVMCGDSTKESDVSILMNGQKADMVFTDPPYNVDYEGYTKDKLTIKSDKMSDSDYHEFLQQVFSNFRTACKDECSFYICHSYYWQRLTEEVLNLCGIIMRNQIVWVKNTFAWGMGRYKSQHEAIFYAYIKNKSDAFYGDKSQTTVWQVNKPSKSEDHPTMKPIELINIALGNSSKTDDIILDLFLGSGSTLIAAETTKRICYGMEIDQHYSDVILRRYKKTFPNAQFKCLTRNDFPFEELFNA